MHPHDHHGMYIVNSIELAIGIDGILICKQDLRKQVNVFVLVGMSHTYMQIKLNYLIPIFCIPNLFVECSLQLRAILPCTARKAQFWLVHLGNAVTLQALLAHGVCRGIHPFPTTIIMNIG